MIRRKILPKKYRLKLSKICLVFFPEYKRHKVLRNGDVRLSGRAITGIPNKTRYNHDHLMDYILPYKLTMFKYNNDQFIGHVFNLRTGNLIAGVNILEFYLEEILKLKLTDEIQDIVVKTHEDYFAEGQDKQSTVYYLLDGQTYGVSDYIKLIVEKRLKIVKPLYYELVGFGMVLLSVGALWLYL